MNNAMTPHPGEGSHSPLNPASIAADSSSLRILHLEDNRLDAEIVRELIRSEFPGSQLTLVSNRFAFVGELELHEYDVIVSDFTMESFDGFEALEIARNRAAEVPFLFYSGTIGDDRAVAAMHSGAQDCVPKGQVKRLGVAIRRALSERAERHRREEAELHSRELEGSLNEAREANRRLEEQTGRVQRLENVGLLAAGVAHDLNNMLAPMLMAVPLLRDSMPDAEGRHLLDTLEKSAQRGAVLVSQILAFAQGGNIEQRAMQPKVLLRDLSLFMSETFPKNIVVEESFPADLWMVKAIPAQIYQVLLNLCVNARDAMPNGGTLGLGAENCRLDDTTIRQVPGSRPGNFVVLRVEDTGCGIRPEVLARIWEPLAVRKGDSKETSLGLPTARSIIKRHSGFIDIRTAVGLGTEVRVYLPAVLPAAPKAA